MRRALVTGRRGIHRLQSGPGAGELRGLRGGRRRLLHRPLREPPRVLRDVVAADITRPEQWVGRVGAVDAVFHQAAITDTTVADQRRMMEVNVEGFGTSSSSRRRPAPSAWCTRRRPRLTARASAPCARARSWSDERVRNFPKR